MGARVDFLLHDTTEELLDRQHYMTGVLKVVERIVRIHCRYGLDVAFQLLDGCHRQLDRFGVRGVIVLDGCVKLGKTNHLNDFVGHRQHHREYHFRE